MLENYDRYAVFPKKVCRKKAYNLLKKELDETRIRKICERIGEIYTRRFVMDYLLFVIHFVTLKFASK